MKISHLPDYIRVKAVNYYMNEKGLITPYSIFDVIDAHTTDLEDAFTWADTVEGIEYWYYCNNGKFKEANNYYNENIANKPLYMMDGEPLEKKRLTMHNLKPTPTMGATARTLLGVLIGGVIAVGIMFIQTILNK